jgi:RimJ/RimL family protein N-acetyltransferase
MSTNLPPTLNGNDFQLRPWQAQDAAWYVEARDEEVFRWTTERRALTIAETEKAIERANSSSTAICLAIADRQNLILLGNIALAFPENDRKSAEIMYWLAPAGRGRGIATKAVRLLCQWAFDSLGLQHITLKTLPGNVRSQAVARHAGFRPVEGVEETRPGEDYVWFELNV